MNHDRWTMKISTAKLRSVTEMLLDHLDEIGVDEIELDVDHYWYIPREFAYDVTTDPPMNELTIGQLSDDWQELLNQLEGRTPALAYKLVWLASIFRAVGEATSG